MTRAAWSGGDGGRADPAVVEAAGTILAALPLPAILLDGNGHVAACNQGVHQLIDGSPLFIDKAGRLRATIPALAETLASALSTPAGERRVMRIADFGPHGDIVLHIARVAPAGTEEPERPLTVVCLGSETGAAGSTLSALRELYGLSPDEAAAAIAIYNGQRITDFARTRSIDIMTALALRERAMQRLGAHRAVDIARRVAMVSQMAPDADALAERAG